MIVLLSGGLDSTVLLAAVLDTAPDDDRPTETLSVNYGQRHARELRAAAAIAAHYRVRHDVINLTPLATHLTGSTLTDPHTPLPEGHYTDTSMAATVVPGRNLIMIACAAAVAAARGHHMIGIAAHAGDHPVYPDCRPEFLTAASLATQLGTAGIGSVTVEAPFAHLAKADIAALGARLGAPLSLSWSCYAGGDIHCGRCGTDVERAEAFALAGVPDPTEYADPGYWRTATQAAR